MLKARISTKGIKKRIYFQVYQCIGVFSVFLLQDSDHIVFSADPHVGFQFRPNKIRSRILLTFRLLLEFCSIAGPVAVPARFLPLLHQTAPVTTSIRHTIDVLWHNLGPVQLPAEILSPPSANRSHTARR